MRTAIYILFGLWRTSKWCLKMAGVGLGVALLVSVTVLTPFQPTRKMNTGFLKRDFVPELCN